MVSEMPARTGCRALQTLPGAPGTARTREAPAYGAVSTGSLWGAPAMTRAGSHLGDVLEWSDVQRAVALRTRRDALTTSAGVRLIWRAS